MERLTTGDAELDTILAGGIPSGTFVVIAGPPGTGKSVLAAQLAFANATPDGPAVKYSTLSESPAKMRRHLAGFSFFDGDRVGQDVALVQLSEFADRAEAAGEDVLAAVSGEILQRTLATSPSMVIVDSSRAFEAYGSPMKLRSAIFALASKLGRTDTVLVFVGEYSRHDLDAPEFAVADVIIELANKPARTGDQRTLRVAKFRGSRFVGGEHTFTITADGLEVWRRMETVPAGAATATDERAPFGDEQLDRMTSGGLPRGAVSLVLGTTGTGKTTLALHWAAAAIRRGETALYVALEEGAGYLLAKADAFGLDFAAARDAGQLVLLDAPAALVDLDELALSIRQAVERHAPDVVVIDAVSSIHPTLRASGRSPAFEAALTRYLQSAGATTLLTHEIRALGSETPASAGFSNLANTLVLLRYMERGSELGRVLSVLKMRRSNHDKGLLQYRITGDGLEAVGEADDVRQITGWTVLGSPIAD